jgi:hypothetical protein
MLRRICIACDVSKLVCRLISEIRAVNPLQLQHPPRACLACIQLQPHSSESRRIPAGPLGYCTCHMCLTHAAARSRAPHGHEVAVHMDAMVGGRAGRAAGQPAGAHGHLRCPHWTPDSVDVTLQRVEPRIILTRLATACPLTSDDC